MSFDHNNLKHQCPRPDIAAYIDGELTAEEEIGLDMHFSVCELCSTVLNEQKLLLSGLDNGLDEADVTLPQGFEKVVATRAASNVLGVRRSSELLNTLIVCSGLLLLILILVAIGGGGARGIALTVFSAVEQIAAFATFVGYIIYSVFLALTIILRSLASQFRFDLLLTTALIFVSVVSLMLASRRWLRTRGV